jgi:8-oxo-dGTP pyrophosphatase MutT (NUDIX family)
VDALFELSASVALWRGNELLLMKRSAGAFGGGGWFLPGGHVEPGERPAAACARELREETEIVIAEADLSLADVMTYDHGGATAHGLVYNASCPEGTEPTINDEHIVAKWYEPEAAIARFFDAERLRGLGVAEDGIALAEEVARVIRSAIRARGMRGPEDRPAEDRPTNW